jgi:hypothetical protein
VVLSLQVKNRGKGFLTTSDGTLGPTGPIIQKEELDIVAVAKDTISSEIAAELKTCKDKNFPAQGLKLIKGESTKISCPLTKTLSANVPVESTKTLQASVGEYWYEFRKEITVTVEPKF